MISKIRDCFLKNEHYNPFKQPYKKSISNFKIAFSRNDESTKISLFSRVSFFSMAIAYSIPLLNTIIYIALEILLRNKPFPYEQVIQKANTEFKNHENKEEIEAKIKELLEDFKYKKNIENEENPVIKALNPFNLDTEDKIYLEARRFISLLPGVNEEAGILKFS